MFCRQWTRLEKGKVRTEWFSNPYRNCKIPLEGRDVGRGIFLTNIYCFFVQCQVYRIFFSIYLMYFFCAPRFPGVFFLNYFWHFFLGSDFFAEGVAHIVSNQSFSNKSNLHNHLPVAIITKRKIRTQHSIAANGKQLKHQKLLPLVSISSSFTAMFRIIASIISFNILNQSA